MVIFCSCGIIFVIKFYSRYTVPSDVVALVDCIGPIPKELGQLDCLEVLDLRGNGLNGEEEMS